jgi:hypothetical protein
LLVRRGGTKWVLVNTTAKGAGQEVSSPDVEKKA